RRENAHIDNGRLIVTPTLTEPVFGTLDNSTIDLWGAVFGDQCTSNYDFGCLQTGNAAQILPPILSSSLHTEKSFSFQYGRIELRAKLPKGNWLRPTFRLLPKYDSYGEYPQSGDIIVLEGNGNAVNDKLEVQSGIAFGAFNDSRMDKSHLHIAADGAFHTYGLYWDEKELYTYVDDPTNVIEKVPTYGDVSFWNQHWDPSLENDISPWRNRPLHAPFDQLMYLNIALRVGGTDGFYENSDDKPWTDEAINYKSTYVNSRNNSYVKDGKLHLRATLTNEAYGDENVQTGVMDLWGTSPYSSCSSPQFNGCRKQSIGKDILPPVQSARIQTMESFSFKYGRIEIKTKLPKGDWLWPGIWMMAKDNKYGPWPSSGELDIMESRGNGPNYTDDRGDPIGNNRFSSCFHFGPAWNKDGYPIAVNDTKALPDGRSYGDEFHTFGFYWDQDEMYSYVDSPENVITRVAEYGKKSFWDIGIDAGAWNASDSYNNFQDGPINAPFDQEMYLIMNVAVGGTSIAKGFLDSGYFPDDRGGKPWHTNDTFPLYNFYSKREDWIDSWKQGGKFSSDMSAMQIDSVKVWGLKGLTTYTNSKNPVHSYEELDVKGESCESCADFADALPACINTQTQACFAKSHLGATCFDSTTPCQAPIERLIFHDSFDTLDESKWQHEITMTGTANKFMNMFVKRRENAHIDNGRLIVTPTLTEP
ncbi:hypothetical protein THRCLA_00211, partial [Thraustotheca clavata]